MRDEIRQLRKELKHCKGGKYTLNRISKCCPEQYFVEQNNTTVGYIRVRNGYITAYLTNEDGQDVEVYEAKTKGDGHLLDDERDAHLKKALKAI